MDRVDVYLHKPEVINSIEPNLTLVAYILLQFIRDLSNNQLLQ